jgi:pectinesterase
MTGKTHILIFVIAGILNGWAMGQGIVMKYDFVVAPDGTGDFKTVQEAIHAVPDMRKNRTIIYIRNGVYKEKLILSASKTNVTFIGESMGKTILTYDDFAQKRNRFGEEMGTSGSASFYVFAEGFAAENITFQNSAGPVGQAVAVRVDGDRIMFRNCRFLGFQDTLYPHGEKSRQYYKNCYVEGTVDFIFGWSTAVFDSCTIYCKAAGYVTAPSTLPEAKYGFVFLNCIITGSAPENTFYLGRPWRPNGKSVFINCLLDKQIKAEGWHNWDKPDAENTCFFAEYNNYGPGSKAKDRVKWAHQLTGEQMKEYTIAAIFGDWDVSKQ